MRRLTMTALGGLALSVLAGGCVPRLYTEDGAGGAATAWQAPENRWPVSPPPASHAGEGLGEGQIALDIRGSDDRGEEVSLWQFHGRWVLVDIATMWCGPCQDLAKGTEYTYQKFRDDGVVYLTVLLENELNEAPTLEELELWATFPSFHEDPNHPYDHITAPILADPKGRSGSAQAVRGNLYPVALLIDPEGRVHERVEPVTEGAIEKAIEEAIAAWPTEVPPLAPREDDPSEPTDPPGQTDPPEQTDPTQPTDESQDTDVGATDG